MAGKKTKDCDTSSTSTSPLKQKEDVGGNTQVLSDTREIGEMRNKCNDAMNFGKSSSTEKVDCALLNVGVDSSTVQNATEFSDLAQNIDWSFADNDPLVPGFEGDVDPGYVMVDSNTELLGFGGNVDSGFPMEDFNTGISAEGQQIPTYQTSPVQTVEDSLVMENEWLQLDDSECTAAQVAEDTTLQKNSGAQPSDQIISSSRGSELAQASNTSVGPSLKRCATQPPSTITHLAQRQTTIHPSVQASAQAVPSIEYPTQTALVPPQFQNVASPPTMPQTVGFCQKLSQTHACLPSPIQTARVPTTSKIADNFLDTCLSCVPLPPPFQTAPVPTQSQINDSVPSVPQTVDFHQTLSQTHAPIQTVHSRSHLAKGKTPLHISKDLDRTHPQRGPMCYLCRKNLSIAPEHPITVLACGHSFHTRCLQGITSADRSENPPCMPCKLGENTK